MFTNTRRSVWSAAGTLLALLTLVGGAAVADGGSEYAYEYHRDANNVNAVDGTQGIRTDPATHTGEGYVHWMQLGNDNSSFVAIGSANGLGAPNFCASQYNAKWDLYTDGRLGGVYFCNTEDANRWNAGDSPGFRIQRTNCGTVSDPQYGWEMRASGITWACYPAAWAAADEAHVGIEHTGNTTGNYTTDRNIDAKYTNMIWRVQGGTFQDWTNGPNYVDPSYTVDHVALGAVNTFLAPLD